MAMSKTLVSRRRMAWATTAMLGVIAGAVAHAEIVAAWSFEAALGSERREIRSDDGNQIADCDTGRIVPGKIGHALRTIPPGPRVSLAPGETRSATTRIQLGSGAWTVECWLWLDPGAEAEGTILEIGAGVRGATELVSRFGIVPRENAVVIGGVTKEVVGGRGGLARPVEFAPADGPAESRGFVREWTLASTTPFPREHWIQLRVVHMASEVLRLFLDGKLVATAEAAGLAALPLTQENYTTLGHDGRGQRRFAGAIDELRVRDDAEDKWVQSAGTR